MQLFAKSRKETRLDYFGNPYEATVTTPIVKTKAELWKEYKAMKANQPEPMNWKGHLPINEDAVNNYFEQELLNLNQ